MSASEKATYASEIEREIRELRNCGEDEMADNLAHLAIEMGMGF